MDFCASHETPTSGRVFRDLIRKKEFDYARGREHHLRYLLVNSYACFLSNLVSACHLLHNWKSFLVTAYS